MKEAIFLFLLTANLDLAQGIESFYGNWRASERVIFKNGKDVYVEWEGLGDPEMLFNIRKDSLYWYLNGRKVLSASHSYTEGELEFEDGRFILNGENRIGLKDTLSNELLIVFERVVPEKYDNPPKQLIGVWDGYTTHLLNQKGDTLNRTFDKCGYSNGNVIAFTEDVMYSAISNSVIWSESIYKYRKDTIFS